MVFYCQFYCQLVPGGAICRHYAYFIHKCPNIQTMSEQPKAILPSGKYWLLPLILNENEAINTIFLGKSGRHLPMQLKDVESPAAANLSTNSVERGGARGTLGGSGAPALSSIYMKRDDRKKWNHAIAKPQPYTTIIPSFVSLRFYLHIKKS